MIFTKAHKILNKNLLELKGYNATHLVREILSIVSTSCCKSYGLLGRLIIIPAVADDTAPEQP